MTFRSDELAVYQKAVKFSLAVSNATGAFPAGGCDLSDRLNHGALGVSSNIAEGHGRRDRNGKLLYFHLARYAAQSCAPVLELCRREGWLPPDRHEHLKTGLDGIDTMLAGLITRLGDETQTGNASGAAT